MFRKELVRCPQAVFFVKSFLSLLYEFKSWFSVEVVSYDLPLRTRKQLVPILSLCLLLLSFKGAAVIGLRCCGFPAIANS